MAEKGAGPARKTKTESLTVRLSPKAKFALELMARIQNRTISAAVEWSLSSAIANVRAPRTASFNPIPLSELVDEVWSTDEAMRLAKLAFESPALLTYEELRTWETIEASEPFWLAGCRGQASALLRDRLRDNWSVLLAHVQKHEQSATVIPIAEEELSPPF